MNLHIRNRHERKEFVDANGLPETKKAREIRFAHENFARNQIIQSRTDILDLQLGEIRDNSMGILGGYRSKQKSNNTGVGARHIQISELSTRADHMVIRGLLHGLADPNEPFEERMQYSLVCDKNKTMLSIGSILVGSLFHEKGPEQSKFELINNSPNSKDVGHIYYSAPGIKIEQSQLESINLDRSIIGHPLDQMARLAISLDMLNK